MNEKKSNRFIAYCERHSFSPIAVLITLILVVAVVVCLGAFSLRPKTVILSKTSALNLKDIGELVTQAGYFTQVQTINKSRDIFGVEVPGTKSNYVYSYDGTIKAGIDFGEIDVSVDETNKIISIRLPKAKILSTEIDDDSFILYNDGSNLFTSLKMEEVNESNSALKNTANETAIKNGILENAISNAKVIIRGFLAGIYDLDIYEIEYLTV